MEFDSPFLIVYIGTSLFSVFLPIRLGYERLGGHNFCGYCSDHNESGKDNNIVIIPWKNTDHVDVIVQSSITSSSFVNEDDDGTDSEGLTLSKYQEQSTQEADEHIDDYSYDNEYCVHNYEPTPHPPCNIGSERSQHNSINNISQYYLLSHRDHISMAIKVAPIWFTSNYFYAISLELTSIASSTVLASMGSIFAFGFATCTKYGDERVTKGKLLGVMLCFLGGVATTWTDVGDDSSHSDDTTLNGGHNHHLRYLRHPASHLPHLFDLTNKDSPIRTLFGDLAGFFSAVGYGAYTVLLRHLCPKDEDRMSMQLLFGYIGVWNMILLSPVAIWVILLSSNDGVNDDNQEGGHPGDSDEWEPSQSSDFSDEEGGDTKNIHTTLTWSIFLFLLLKGLLDNVLSDYLWARAVILTSATVASVGVGLTIPMAFVADWIMGSSSNDKNGNTQAGEVWGALLVLLGFLFVNVNVFGENGDNVGEEEGIAEELNFEAEGENGAIDAHSAHDVDPETYS